MKPESKYTWGTDSRETLVTLRKLHDRDGGYVTSGDILRELWHPSEKPPEKLRIVICNQLQNFRERGWIEIPEDASLHPKEHNITKWGREWADYYEKELEEEDRKGPYKRGLLGRGR